MTAQNNQRTSLTAVLCVLGSCISLQLGAAFAVRLFPLAGTWATASVRLLFAAAILLAVSRPNVRTWTTAQWKAVVLFGLSMGFMNGFFYAALGRIPLGTAVTIEFLGPLILAAVLSRTLRDAVCVVLAFAGMGLIALDTMTGNPLDPLGVTFVLIAAFFWAMYILASKHAGSLVPGQGGLAVALGVGGAVIFPLGASGAGAIFSGWDTLGLALGTALLASLVPYSLELIALRRLPANTFSILIALEPVFAAGFGWLLLAQVVSPLKATAIVLVIAASIGQTAGRANTSGRGDGSSHRETPGGASRALRWRFGRRPQR